MRYSKVAGREMLGYYVRDILRESFEKLSAAP